MINTKAKNQTALSLTGTTVSLARLQEETPRYDERYADCYVTSASIP